MTCANITNSKWLLQSTFLEVKFTKNINFKNCSQFLFLQSTHQFSWIDIAWVVLWLALILTFTFLAIHVKALENECITCVNNWRLKSKINVYKSLITNLIFTQQFFDVLINHISKKLLIADTVVFDSCSQIRIVLSDVVHVNCQCNLTSS